MSWTRSPEAADRDRTLSRERGRVRYAEGVRPDPTVLWAAQMRYRYGITTEQWQELYDAQGGRCGICRNPQREGGNRLCVDHDHETGVVRGLLCHGCNRRVAWIEAVRRGEYRDAEAWIDRVAIVTDNNYDRRHRRGALIGRPRLDGDS